MAAKKKKKTAKPKPAKKSTSKPARKKKPALKKATAPKKPAAKKKASSRKRGAAAAAPKLSAKQAAKKKAAKNVTTRRDRPGHIASKYGRELLAKSGGPDRDSADKGFLKRARSNDDLAERLGEEVIEEATSGENEGEDILDQEVPEERGGPFVVTRASQEFGYEPDASNPKRSRREPFPRT